MAYLKHHEALCGSFKTPISASNYLGTRKGFSTETQLISVLDDWLSSLDKRIRTDVLLIDFSKAFDSVPLQRLLLKLNYYGITGNSLFWSKNVLLYRTQCVQVSGTSSSWISVTSGVPQGTVLGPLLFLIYINDIVHNLNSKIKLFADDAGVSLEAGYRRYTAVFVVTNLPLTAGYCGQIFTQTLIVIAAYFD